MSFVKRLVNLAIVLIVAEFLPLSSGQTMPVTISDTIYNIDGTTANGTIYISNPAFFDSTNTLHPANTIQTTVVNGVVNVSLTPTTTAISSPTPVYTVRYSMLNGPPSGAPITYWAVSASGPLTIAQVQTTPFSLFKVLNYSQTFASVSSVTLTHNLNTTAVVVACYNGSNTQVTPSSVVITSANVVTVTFSGSTTGYCVVI